jgi:hypothetical protein
MTARNGSAEWHGNVQGGAGTVTVGNGVFQGACSCASRWLPVKARAGTEAQSSHCSSSMRQIKG